MNAVDAVLGDLFDTTAAPWRADDSAWSVVTVDDDVIVNIAEDETASLVHLFSAPGYAARGEDLTAPLQALEDGQACDFRRAIYVHDDTRLMMVLRTLPRERLDSVFFQQQLQCHVAECRAWNQVLLPTPEEVQEARLVDLPPGYPLLA
jgi:hypothetical protein